MKNTYFPLLFHDILGYEGLYRINQLDIVQSCKPTKGQIAHGCSRKKYLKSRINQGYVE